MRSLLCTVIGAWMVTVAAYQISLKADEPSPEPAGWQAVGWGGGGFYWSAAFHPARPGVIYMGGDCAGAYKTEDGGQHWRLINDGLAGYSVYSLATDRTNPRIVYAATEQGLCKSTDEGEHWQLLANTGRKELRITGERNQSIHAIAVDPAHSDTVYAGSPGGRVYKSIDGGQSWTVAWEKKSEADSVDALRVQFGGIDNQWFGGCLLPLSFPKGLLSTDCTGIGFSFKGGGAAPRDAYFYVFTQTGVGYRSKQLCDIFLDTQWHEVLLSDTDFVLDPDYVKKHPDQAKSLSAQPDWSAIQRIQFTCVSPPDQRSIGKFSRFYFALKRDANGATAAENQPVIQTVRDFTQDKKAITFGNARIGDATGGPVYSVAVAEADPSHVAAATRDDGLLLSDDAGVTWRNTDAPRSVASAQFAATNGGIILAACFRDGIWKSTDGGKTWTNVTPKYAGNVSYLDVVVSPSDSNNVFVIGSAGWDGVFFRSADGGQTWTSSSKLAVDLDANPTLPKESANGVTGLSNLKNLAVNPQNPSELFIAGNWRPCISRDGGITWTESDRGADISCVHDICFSGEKTYVAAMDEGTLVSDDGGKSWRQLWPLKWNGALSGHNWKLAVRRADGVDHILCTASPWDVKIPNRLIISDDGGAHFKVIADGLPDYIPHANTMWGQGYARALAVDPNNPQVVYLGIDGDPSDGNSGGGVFKSQDGGLTWSQLPHQPGSRRMFYGLAVDPTDSQRLYWAACGNGGGLYRSDDGGDSWSLVFSRETWVFNILLTTDGTIYCPGKNLWRSTDHGKTWKQLTHWNTSRAIVGLAADPDHPDTLWVSAVTWGSDNDGAVYQTTDGGQTWRDITGNLPYRKPLILRFNSQTRELWAGGVGLFKIRQ